MKNLEQTRAANALEPGKDLSRSAVNKLPAMILAYLKPFAPKD
jgi:hypothetical protein